jgi:hypothetical protein
LGNTGFYVWGESGQRDKGQRHKIVLLGKLNLDDVEDRRWSPPIVLDYPLALCGAMLGLSSAKISNLVQKVDVAAFAAARPSKLLY